VHGIEVNADFVEFGRSVAKDRGLEDTVTFHHVTDQALPLSADSIDCKVAKNVLVYVDDPLKTYLECYRVLRQGGRVHAIEGDWDFTLAEPVPEDDWKILAIIFRYEPAQETSLISERATVRDETRWRG
jgi:ubiquinone/menaquinone biosynthesis C-methylase UbiE